ALTSAGTVKIPMPIMLVTTKADAPQTLSARRNWAPASTVCCGLLLIMWLVVNQFVVTSHPVGQQKVNPIAFAAPIIAAVDSIWIAVPFAYRQFVIRQDDQSLPAIEPVIQSIHRNVQPA